MNKNNEEEIINSENDTEETVNDEEVVDEGVQDTQEDNKQAENVDELQKKIKTLEAQKEHWKSKATKQVSKTVETKSNKDDNLSAKDLYALMSSQVPQEDVEEVVKASKLLGKSIQEVLKDETVKTILKNRAEYRATAQASNTVTKKTTTKKETPEEIVKKASKGEIPEKGTSEAEELFWARRGGRR